MSNPQFEVGGEPAPRALEEWLEDHVPGYQGPARLSKSGFGQSNPTFRVSSPSGHYVLRRKPFGTLLPKAHMIEREYRVLAALQSTPVPTPAVYALCEDASVLGAPFYLMEFVEGRIFYDQRMPGVPARERAALFDGMNAAVAHLHGIEPEAVGLSDYGRSEGFLARQIATWTRQYRSSEGEPIAAMERLIEWLPANLPPEQRGHIFHGDLRLDNMMFHPTEPRVVALLDWELSTLGDRLADFAYHMMVWRVAPDLFRGFAGLDFAKMGIPAEEDYVSSYLERSGQSELPHWDFYLAFAFFRIAAILQGVWSRAQTGQASASDAEETGRKAAPLAVIGWDIARGARA